MKRVVTSEEMVTGKLPVPGGGGQFGIMVDAQLGGSEGFSLLVNEVRQGYKGKMHAHPEEQCWYILSGRGLISIDGVDYEVGPGMAALAPSNAPHQVEAHEGEPLRYVLLYVPGGPEKELREKGEDSFSGGKAQG